MATISRVYEVYEPPTAPPRQARPARAAELEAAIKAGYITLARALVRRAILDAQQRKDDELQAEAAEWIGSEEGLDMAELAGFDSSLLRRWSLSGCMAMAEK